LIKDRGFTTKEGNEACKTKVIGATTTQLKTFLLWQKLFDKMQKWTCKIGVLLSMTPRKRILQS